MTQEETKNEEEVKPIVEEASWDKPDYTFIPSGNHIWHQSGFYIICDSCDLEHATYVGKDRILVGIEDGKPLLKKRKELGMV